MQTLPDDDNAIQPMETLPIDNLLVTNFLGATKYPDNGRDTKTKQLLL